MSNSIVISSHADLWEQLVTRRITSGDDTWVNLMLFLGKSWTIKVNQQGNRRNVYLSQKEYWKGTYEQRRT